jgi:uncharacterized protein (DUF427 family)
MKLFVMQLSPPSRHYIPLKDVRNRRLNDTMYERKGEEE